MMGLPNEHQLKFNSFKDAKSPLEAIEKRFGGNDATKKTHRNLLKQQYESFSRSSSESLDQTFDKLQKFVSQLELLGKVVSQEDINHKFLRSLPYEWGMHVVYEYEAKGISSSTNNQNMAFVSSSSNNFNSSNGVNADQGVNTANGVNTTSSQGVNTANGVNTTSSQEIDLKWQMAILTIRARRFLKNTRRKLNLNGNDFVAFDKTKVECYNCHKRGHFARECRAPRGHNNRSRDVTRRTVPVETPNSLALVSYDELGGYDWSDQAEEGPTNYALMAYSTLLASSLDFEASDCSKSSLKAVENLKSTNEKLLSDLRKSEIMVVAYKEGLKYVEQRLGFFKTNESKYIEQINVLKINIHGRGRALTEL
nr:hypothetical protein [Tanacetum cinerariifolium]